MATQSAPPPPFASFQPQTAAPPPFPQQPPPFAKQPPPFPPPSQAYAQQPPPFPQAPQAYAQQPPPFPQTPFPPAKLPYPQQPSLSAPLTKADGTPLVLPAMLPLNNTKFLVMAVVGLLLLVFSALRLAQGSDNYGSVLIGLFLLAAGVVYGMPTHNHLMVEKEGFTVHMFLTKPHRVHFAEISDQGFFFLSINYMKHVAWNYRPEVKKCNKLVRKFLHIFSCEGHLAGNYGGYNAKQLALLLEQLLRQDRMEKWNRAQRKRQ